MGPSQISYSLLPLFLRSQLGITRAPGASAEFLLVLSLIYKAEVMMTLTAEGRGQDSIHGDWDGAWHLETSERDMVYILESSSATS